ncbi:hypothetical protein PV08_08749 [Exophiala spinifera]|uniref:FAD-binding domain-containing protein n=1 Tax=Exophiala spinifera TaxID=91928 RepID=A0A0D1YET1_9EURO|nr:uncharacterized protein PV08_08749 [Exophiala spinifera]KIW13561.1 hypothetical protein PV08_08749 [Exophiala spinifera]
MRSMGEVKFTRVLVVGAGPVGLLTALMLAQGGIDVDVIDSATQIDPRPRGIAYGPPAVRVLRRAGVLDKAFKRGLEGKKMIWRELNGNKITEVDFTKDPTFTDRSLILPVHILAGLLYEELGKLDNAKVHWGCKYVGHGQDDSHVLVEAERDGQTETFDVDFMVGCDGGQSAVRRALFKDSFPGKTWDVQIVAMNIRYDGFEKAGWSDTQWIVDREHWGMACKIDNTGLWRFGYGERRALGENDLMEGRAAKMERLLPGSPKEGEYEVLRWSPFVMNNRCVEKMHVGRVLLAGDAAHLCNPMGGLGLTGGISDVGSLVDALRGIHEEKASLKILEIYDQTRREIFNKFIDPISSANLERIWIDGSTALEKDPTLQYMHAAAQDPARLGHLLRVSFQVDPLRRRSMF